MSNDKTLATVKHGGCVQLPTSERERFEARAKRADYDINRYEEAPDRYLNKHTRDAWDSWQAALSAQPSPGGQGDGLVESLVQVMNAQYDGLGYLPADVLGVLNMAVEALADRQPVCATVKDSLTVGGGMPLVWVSPGQLEEFRNGTSSFGSRIPARIEKGGLFDMPLYATPPAQAVDLADFKALYRAYVRLLESGRDRIIDLGGTCDPVDVMEANDVDLQAARRVIDSQAVGK